MLFDDVPPHARTAEVRPLKAQSNVEEVIADDLLVVGRLHYLRRITAQGVRLELSPEFMSGRLPGAEAGARMFREFILQSRCHPADYLSRLPRNRDEGGREWRLWRETYERLLGNACPRGVERAGKRAKRGARGGK